MAESKDEPLQQARKIHVHVKEKVISVSCGSAEQRVKWLGHVGIARWDSENNQGWTKLGAWMHRCCCCCYCPRPLLPLPLPPPRMYRTLRSTALQTQLGLLREMGCPNAAKLRLC